MTSPPFDPSQRYTQADPNAGGYTADNPYSTPTAYGPPPADGQPPGYGPIYGQTPVYGQPFYGAPAQYPYPVNPAETNTMAILAIVFAFVLPPLGIVFGHMARGQIRQRFQQGSGLAMAGMILGYVFCGLTVAYCAVVGLFISHMTFDGF